MLTYKWLACWFFCFVCFVFYTIKDPLQVLDLWQWEAYFFGTKIHVRNSNIWPGHSVRVDPGPALHALGTHSTRVWTHVRAGLVASKHPESQCCPVRWSVRRLVPRDVGVRRLVPKLSNHPTCRNKCVPTSASGRWEPSPQSHPLTSTHTWRPSPTPVIESIRWRGTEEVQSTSPAPHTRGKESVAF